MSPFPIACPQRTGDIHFPTIVRPLASRAVRHSMCQRSHQSSTVADAFIALGLSTLRHDLFERFMLELLCPVNIAKMMTASLHETVF